MKIKLPDFIPAHGWARNMTGETLRSDAISGFSSAAVVIPQGVAFATIAGLPPEYGLYTAMITAVIAALWGSSMVMISGPTTAISAILFATLSGMAPAFSPRFIELALMMTILVGLFQLMAGLVRLGGLVSFVSHSVITAFTAAAALLIGVSQLAGAMGVKVEPGGNVIERLYGLFEASHMVNPFAVLIAMITLFTAIFMASYLPKLPGVLIAIIFGSVVNYALGGENFGVSMVGEISASLPSFAPPTGALGDMARLAPGAAAIALVALLEAISIGRAFAVRRKEEFDANQEMVGQGLSNTIGGFFQCYAGSGSFTRSGLNEASGARTPMSAVFAAIFLAIILVLVSPLIAFIPTPAMAGLILFVAYKLIDFRELKHIVTTSRSETVILFLTIAAALFIELDFAIYVGVIASFAVFIYDSSHPSIRVSAPVVTASGRRKFKNADIHSIDECPQVVTFRLDGPLYFGSVEHVEDEVKKMRRKRPYQKHMIFYLKGTGKIDLAAGDFLIKLIRDVREAGGSLHLVAVFEPLLDSLRRFHVIEELGEDHLHISKGDALSAIIENDLNMDICAGCQKRVFLECDGLPNNALDALKTDDTLKAAE